MIDLLKRREKNKRWRLNNPQKLKEIKHSEYQSNRETYLENRRRYVQAHKYDIDFREKNRADSKRRIKNLRLKLLELLGNKCGECGYFDIRALQIDHKNGDGYKDRKKFSVSKFYKFYITNPKIALKKLQILCANCNQIKRYENKENRKPVYKNLIKVNYESKSIGYSEYTQIFFFIARSEKLFWHRIAKIVLSERKRKLMEMSAE